MGMGAVCKHMDWGPEILGGNFPTSSRVQYHLRFAWQFTSPCTAGVKGGISKRDRSRRNIPKHSVNLGASKGVQSEIHLLCISAWPVSPSQPDHCDRFVEVLHSAPAVVDILKPTCEKYIFEQTCNTRYSSGWREKPTSFGTSVGCACFAQANIILLWLVETKNEYFWEVKSSSTWSLHMAWCWQSQVSPNPVFLGFLHLLRIMWCALIPGPSWPRAEKETAYTVWDRQLK